MLWSLGKATEVGYELMNGDPIKTMDHWLDGRED